MNTTSIPTVVWLMAAVLVALVPSIGLGATEAVATPDPDTSPTIFRVEAYAGQPFGVGILRYRMRMGDEMIDRSGATRLIEKNNRVFYPVFSQPAANKFFQRVTGNTNSEPNSMHSIWFLFRGDAPLELTLLGASGAFTSVPVTVTREKKFNRIMGQWWREFNAVAAEQEDWGDYPPLIEAYLRSMLSQRIGLPLPRKRQPQKDPLAKTLELIFDVETLRSESVENAMLGLSDIGAASEPLPSDIFWTEADIDERDFRNIESEPFAYCVPEECFYLRFGTWQNQIWLKRLMEEFGGDLSRMVNLRGYKSRVKSKFLNQLAIESTEFDQLFGGNLISDVAVIGYDMFFEDGSAVGVLLRAKNSDALQRNLTGKRQKFAAAQAKLGCELLDLDIDGVKVQFLKTPDNRYRSFYVVQGDNHLITSSVALARRFIEASGGTRSLAQSVEFRYARQQMPLSREDTVFIFVPSKLLHNLLGPHYQIELARRNRSITDMQIIELADLAAQNEGFDITQQDKLVEQGFLPTNFGLRPDGSQLTRKGDYWIDSIRGRRGFFAPIPDVSLSGVTTQEVAWYQERRTFLTENLSQLDPMFVGLKRYQHENNIERVVYDARIAPFGQEKYGWLFSMLGAPLSDRVQGSPNDIVSFQASLQGGVISRKIGAHQLFGAIQDELVGSTDLSPTSLIKSLDLIRSAPGYIGSWPKAGYLDWMPKLGGQTDDYGFTFSRMLGIWRLQWEDFSAVSFERNRLIELQQHARIVDAERPAQVRIEVGDVAHSQLKRWATIQNYRQSWEASIANTRLLNMMSQQFNLPPEAAKTTTENLLDVDLVCSLGGEYELHSISADRQVWRSTEWPNFTNPQLPADYTSPLLKWFRGLQLELVKTESQFSVHGYLDIERSGGSQLPSFNLFKGFGDMFGSKPDEK